MRKGTFFLLSVKYPHPPPLPLFTTVQEATPMCPTNMGESDKPPTTIEWEPVSPAGFIAWIETQPLGYHNPMAHGGKQHFPCSDTRSVTSHQLTIECALVSLAKYPASLLLLLWTGT